MNPGMGMGMPMMPGGMQMMPGMMPGMAPDAGAIQAEKIKQARFEAVVTRKTTAKDAEKVTTVFVGGLRKSTSEDKVIGHFAKYGQVDSVDIKRLPDGSSRGFAFVKFNDKESVDKVIEAKANHMIDNKWVAVRPHGGSAFQAAQHAERAKDMVQREKDKKESEGPATQDDYEEKWSEKYLQQAASLQDSREEEEDKEKDTPMNPMMAMMMNPMMQMMMNPMMMGGMNPMMMGARPMMGCACGGCPGAGGGGETGGGSTGAAEGAPSSSGSPGGCMPGCGCMPCCMGGCMPGCMGGCPCGGCCGCGGCGCGMMPMGMSMPGMPSLPAGAAKPAETSPEGETPEGSGGPVKEGGGENRFQPY
ncbi:unnamed protein product [Effrenium voratum]|uniref:RRM domain-containing protein n=1 Tax=Effrenium voratum TaxID=2562239 RepID=A0AA36NGP1_9DINO|nr:unnamed protein product [Effrenium voratum]CAJ1445727.1 unnamed protein product [Effrenium voratum]